MKKNERDREPRMSLVRRARTKLRRGDYSREIASDVLVRIAEKLLADARR